MYFILFVKTIYNNSVLQGDQSGSLLASSSEIRTILETCQSKQRIHQEKTKKEARKELFWMINLCFHCVRLLPSSSEVLHHRYPVPHPIVPPKPSGWTSKNCKGGQQVAVIPVGYCSPFDRMFCTVFVSVCVWFFFVRCYHCKNFLHRKTGGKIISK